MSLSPKYHNKELSWLSFNSRVLEEANDKKNLLLERIKFLAIHDSNLQEFCRNKLGILKRKRELTKQAGKLDINLDHSLSEVRKTINKTYIESQLILYDEIVPELAKHNIHVICSNDLDKACLKEVHSLFRSTILTFLQPRILPEKRIKKESSLLRGIPYFFIKLEKDQQTVYGLVNIPSDKHQRFYQIKCLEGVHFITIDDIIKLNLPFLFKEYNVIASFSFRAIRNDVFNIDDEFSGILKDKIKYQIEHLSNIPSTTIYDASMPREIFEQLRKKFRFKKKDLIPGGRYHDIKDLLQLPTPENSTLQLKKFSSLSYPPFEKYECIFQKISRQDHLIHFPFHSYNYVLRFFNESSSDPHVKEIRITLYRLAKESMIAHALINAARNGKRVIVFIELKARDDEAHNLEWAEQMERSGVKVVYSLPELKVHAKMALVIRKESEGDRFYTYLSTGNFNEQSARLYSDIGFFTKKKKITESVSKTFEFIYKKKQLKNLGDFLVTNHNMKKKFIKMIRKEIQLHQGGNKAKIILKMNNLEEKQMIDMLYEAANVGVELVLIVRSICCFNIDYIKGQNVKLIRIVDSYLEHARLVYFHNGGKEVLYASSADWMQRNLQNRVEIAFPIKDKKIKKELISILLTQGADNQKATVIDGKLRNISIKPQSKEIVRSQYSTYNFYKKKSQVN